MFILIRFEDILYWILLLLPSHVVYKISDSVQQGATETHQQSWGLFLVEKQSDWMGAKPTEKSFLMFCISTSIV